MIPSICGIYADHPLKETPLTHHQESRWRREDELKARALSAEQHARDATARYMALEGEVRGLRESSAKKDATLRFAALILDEAASALTVEGLPNTASSFRHHAESTRRAL